MKAALALVVLIVASRAAAQEPAVPAITPAPEPAPPEPAVPEGTTRPEALESAATGYLDQRLTLARVRRDGLVPGEDVPRVIVLTEANVQLKLRAGEALAAADASFFFQKGLAYPGGSRDNPAYRPLSVLSELYGSYGLREHVQLTLGKKRVVWGPGLVINPTDLLNPPKDPTDPSLQRAGAWLGRLELPFERFTLTFVGAARATAEYGGVPAALGVYPAGDPADDGRVHVAAAARLYVLAANTDFNLEYFFTNLYNDAFARKSRLGFSLSRLIGSALEVHVEALGQLGSARLFVNEACDLERASVVACAAGGAPVVARSKLDRRTPNLRGLFGARYTFADDAILGVDYLLATDGYAPAEWRRLLRALADARAAGLAVAGLPLGPAGGADGGTPQRFVFEPFRRHYLLATYLKPRIRDDFTLSLTVMAGLEDLSGQAAPQLQWSARSWLNLALQVFVPLPAARPTEARGKDYGELTLAPADYRALVSARVFY
jgi:hypothetical protein